MSIRKGSADHHGGLVHNSNLGSLAQQMGGLSLQPVGTTHMTNQPTSIFSPAPTRNFRSMSFDSQPLMGVSTERSYLVENLRRQHGRGERLTLALHNVETQLGSAQGKAEARKLRKGAGLLRSKIAESHKQEELITMRLNDLQNEDLRYFYQAQHSSLFPYAYSLQQPWSPVLVPPVMPLTPISPLTPLPPALYQPTPAFQHPAFPFTPAYPTAYPIAQYDQESHLSGIEQAVSVPQQVGGDFTAKVADPERHSLAVEPVRRWSLADSCSPSAKDKRMSMPGLKTIWRFS